MAKPLVIVESPAKAKTLGRFLGSKYRVEASFGHIRDLPESAAEVPKEIKQKEVKDALDNPGAVNEDLVRAQESRRILDRLYGYTLSPLLWKKVQTGLSAGRVQSVAVRLIVEREEERRAFRTSVYWDLEARLKGEGREFIATLVRVGDQRIATGKDFDAKTGELKNANVRLLDEAAATTLATAIRANVPWTVTSV